MNRWNGKRSDTVLLAQHWQYQYEWVSLKSIKLTKEKAFFISSLCFTYSETGLTPGYFLWGKNTQKTIASIQYIAENSMCSENSNYSINDNNSRKGWIIEWLFYMGFMGICNL